MVGLCSSSSNCSDASPRDDVNLSVSVLAHLPALTHAAAHGGSAASDCFAGVLTHNLMLLTAFISKRKTLQKGLERLEFLQYDRTPLARSMAAT